MNEIGKITVDASDVIEEIRDVKRTLTENYNEAMKTLSSKEKIQKVNAYNKIVNNRVIANIEDGQFYCSRCGMLMQVSNKIPYTVDVPDKVRHTIQRVKMCGMCYDEMTEELNKKNSNTIG